MLIDSTVYQLHSIAAYKAENPLQAVVPPSKPVGTGPARQAVGLRSFQADQLRRGFGAPLVSRPGVGGLLKAHLIQALLHVQPECMA